MFKHIFYYRFLTGIRDKQMLFWTLLFPIILATLFNFAFSNLNGDEIFNSVPVAVITNDYWDKDLVFQSIMEELSEGDQAIFNLQKLNTEQADELLNDAQIIGYIIPGETFEIVVKNSGMQQSILKIFTDEYMQVRSSINRLAAENPQLDFNLLFSQTKSYLEDKPISSSNPDSVLTYFYALIAMACLYGGFWGLKEIISVKANLSDQAARVNLSPVPKMKQFLYSIAAAFILHFASVILLLIYLSQIIGIKFGDRVWLIILASLISSSLGVSIGALIGVISNISEGIKVSILIAFSMITTFFSGLMVADMKFIITNNAPIMRWINPANLVSDSFYSLYYYDSLDRFWQNIAAMLVFQLICAVIIFSVMRRQRYASI